MRLSFVLFLLSATPVLAQKRCDTPKTDIKCFTVPEITSLETTKCQPYHVFIARGTDERGPGRQGNLTRVICDALGRDNCGYENIDYPAKSRFVGKDAWCRSAETGVKNGRKQLSDYAKRCPESKLIVMGYSQGASVVQDILGGGGGKIFKCEQKANAGLDRTKAPGKNIAAALAFGSVARAAGQPYAVHGGKDFHGTRTRTPAQLEGLKPYTSVLRDYCNFGDYLCASNSDPQGLPPHLTYFELYNEEVRDWVVKTVTAKKHGEIGKEKEKQSGAAKSGAAKSGAAKKGKEKLKEKGSHLTPLMRSMPSWYWLTAALLVMTVLSWSVLLWYAPLRKKWSE